MAEMLPTMEILERIKRNSEMNEGEVFTRLYRYMLRPDLYYVAYKNLYSNNGAATKGVNDDTADGFSEEKIFKIIKSLTDESQTDVYQKVQRQNAPIGNTDLYGQVSPRSLANDFRSGL